MLALPEATAKTPHSTPHGAAKPFMLPPTNPSATETLTVPAGESCAERIARHLEALREVSELARGLARHLAAEISAADRQSPATDEKSRRRGPDLRLMFDRVVRLIRDIIKLENIIGGWPNDTAETPPSRREAASPEAAAPPSELRLSRHERRSLEKRLRLARSAGSALA